MRTDGDRRNDPHSDFAFQTDITHPANCSTACGNEHQPRNGGRTEWTQWELFGRNPADPRHIEQSTIDIIKYNKPMAGLDEKEAAIIEFGRETFGRRKVSSETFAKVLGLFGRKGTVDLLELMASYAGTAGQLTAIDEQLQPGQKPLLPPHEVSVGTPRTPGL
jgi:hypothetical protein